MKKKEILRVVQLCLPKLSDKADGDDNNDGQITHHDYLHIHDESDIKVSSICSLWAGMGHIYKVQLPAAATASPAAGKQQAATKTRTLVIKHVATPRSSENLSFGDRRKADCYQVEANFYDKLAPRLIQQQQKQGCPLMIPTPYLVERDSGKSKNEVVICMKYVESVKDVVSDDDEAVQAVLTWLAAFHAAYWGSAAVDAIVDEMGLQKLGSYWHLDTRPDEHAAMPNTGWQGRLKRAAKAIDTRLKRNDSMQCLIHGDAKDANVLYSRVGNKKLQVTMCDYQYVGKGPPTKDLAYYFISSVSPENEDAALEFYLNELTQRLAAKAASAAINGASDTTEGTAYAPPPPPPPPTMQELKESMDLAYCDFYRFMCGWGFWGADGNNGQERVQRILDRLDGGKDLGSEEAYEEAVRREYG